jgi:acetyl esterase/lipase
MNQNHDCHNPDKGQDASIHMNTNLFPLRLALGSLTACITLSTHSQNATPPPAPGKPNEPTKAVAKAPRKNAIPPTIENLAYGPHERNVLDFWKAESNKPTPLLFYIHGGGWQAGDKAGTPVEPYLKAGISVVAINYRYVSQAQDVVPPVKAPLHDAARALQFVRSKATEWNIDKSRIAASGGSAGACSSLWLAFHPDLANPQSQDPVARESTRLLFAAVNGAQTTLDPHQMREWTPNSRYGAHAFGLKSFDEFHDKRESIKEFIAEYSPYALVSSDDPSIYLFYNNAPELGKEQKDPTHTANFGVKLQERVRSVGVECELVYPGTPEVKHPSIPEAIIDKLTNTPAAK